MIELALTSVLSPPCHTWCRVTLDGERAWCPRCGADFDPHDPRLVALHD